MRKEKILRMLAALLSCCLIAGCGSPQRDELPMVILDCDMTFFGDDAMCMTMLVQADSLGMIDLLGVTITGGNSFAAVGTNAALRQLEMLGRSDIPVYVGTDEPLGGFRDPDAQSEIVGEIDGWGAMHDLDKYIPPGCFHDLGSFYERKYGYSETGPQEMRSPEFMAAAAEKYPGRITVISTGAATNIAEACTRFPDFAANTAGIIYMAGSVSGGGSYTKYADFNCFYDAESFAVCYGAEFPTQTVIPHEIRPYSTLGREFFDSLAAAENSTAAHVWTAEKYGLFRRDGNYKISCNDAVAAAVYLFPDIVTGESVVIPAVDCDHASPAYGATTFVTADESCIRVIGEIDAERYRALTADLLCRQ